MFRQSLKLHAVILILQAYTLSGQSIHQFTSRQSNLTEMGETIKYNSNGELILGLDLTFTAGGTGTTFPTNVWLEQYDTLGNLQWTLSSNYTNNQYDSQFTDIAVDQSDNIYITGVFIAPSFTLGGKTVYSQPNIGMNFFLAKVSSSGIVEWLKAPDTSSSFPAQRWPTDLSITDQGELLMTGVHYRDFDFGGATFLGEPSVPHLNNIYPPCNFYTKLDPNGNVIWNRRVRTYPSKQSNGRCGLHEIFSDNRGSIYMTIGLDSSLVIGGDTVTSPQPMHWADRNGLVRVDEKNGHLKASCIIVSPINTLSNLKLDNCGKPVLLGWFKNSVSIGGKSLQAQSQTYSDVYVAKLDSNLNCLWLERHGSDLGDMSAGLDINDRNDIFFGFSFWGNYQYDSTTFQPSGTETAIIKLDSSGNYQWENHTTGGNVAVPRDLAVSPSNRPTFVGGYNGTQYIDNQSVSSAGGYDLMLATFVDNQHPGFPSGCASQNMSHPTPGLSAALSLYPNPASDRLFIELPATAEGYSQKITLYNTQQKAVLTTHISADENHIDIGSLPKGIYFLTLHTTTGKAVKFVKQ